MEIYGKEYGFLYTVGAEQEIAQLCPGQDLRRLPELLKGRTAEATDAAAELLCILSKWSEKSRRYFDPDYPEEPLTRELVDILSIPLFQAAQAEAIAAIARDRAATVEAAPQKKSAAIRSS